MPQSANINGTPCPLGSTCNPVSGSVVVNMTAITGGTPGDVVFDNSGLVGEKATTGSGSVVLSTGTGVDCSGSPTSSFTTVKGIVTHC